MTADPATAARGALASIGRDIFTQTFLAGLLLGAALMCAMFLLGMWYVDHIGNAVLVMNKVDLPAACAAIGRCTNP